MENPLLAVSEEPDVPECDVSAMIAMLDYLIVEISRVDAMAAQCLILARRSLMDLVTQAPVRAN
jgi:hypothetical protein